MNEYRNLHWTIRSQTASFVMVNGGEVVCIVTLHLYSFEWETSRDLNMMDLLNSIPDTTKLATVTPSVTEFMIRFPISSCHVTVGVPLISEDLVAVHVRVNSIPFSGTVGIALILTVNALTGSTVKV